MAHSGVSGLWCMLSLVSGDDGGSFKVDKKTQLNQAQLKEMGQ